MEKSSLLVLPAGSRNWNLKTIFEKISQIRYWIPYLRPGRLPIETASNSSDDDDNNKRFHLLLSLLLFSINHNQNTKRTSGIPEASSSPPCGQSAKAPEVRLGKLESYALFSPASRDGISHLERVSCIAYLRSSIKSQSAWWYGVDINPTTPFTIRQSTTMKKRAIAPLVSPKEEDTRNTRHRDDDDKDKNKNG
jgi:hypothetical protein